jgi:hypothetical protein
VHRLAELACKGHPASEDDELDQSCFNKAGELLSLILHFWRQGSASKTLREDVKSLNMCLNMIGSLQFGPVDAPKVRESVEGLKEMHQNLRKVLDVITGDLK